MFCKFCGKENPDGAKFCSECGKDLSEAVVVREPVAVPPKKKAASVDIEERRLSGQILMFSIFGLALGLTGWFSLLGLIFSAIARSKVKKYQDQFGPTHGRASVGNGISIGGLVVSIVCMAIFTLLLAFWLLYIVLCIVIVIVYVFIYLAAAGVYLGMLGLII